MESSQSLGTPVLIEVMNIVAKYDASYASRERRERIG
jgi:hypothetical protein